MIELDPKSTALQLRRRGIRTIVLGGVATQISPGGADSVAIIAASSNVDLPFVMARQTARFILVLLVGPTLARTVAKWTGS
jgi:uncharacterized membrane protein AbrB (regulator of aidB expression)